MQVMAAYISPPYKSMNIALYHPQARVIGKELNGMTAADAEISGIFPLACGDFRAMVWAHLSAEGSIYGKNSAPDH